MISLIHYFFLVSFQMWKDAIARDSMWQHTIVENGSLSVLMTLTTSLFSWNAITTSFKKIWFAHDIWFLVIVPLPMAIVCRQGGCLPCFSLLVFLPWFWMDFGAAIQIFFEKLWTRLGMHYICAHEDVLTFLVAHTVLAQSS